MKFLYCLALLLALMLCGCNSGDETFVFTGPSQTESETPVVGKLFLGAEGGNIPVSAVSFDGSVLSSATTDASGNFFIRGSFPSDFRVIATVGDGIVFAREVRDFGPGQFQLINVPTSLVSLASVASPGTPIRELEARIKSALGLPSELPIDDVVAESLSEPFSHVDFFIEAARNGGEVAFATRLVNEASGNGPVDPAPFRLSGDTMNAPTSGLHPRIAQLVDAARSDTRVRLSVNRPFSRGVANLSTRVDAPQILGRLVQAQGVRAQNAQISWVGEASELLGFAGGGLTDSIRSAGIDTGYTWVAEQLGWHFGTTVTLDAIVGTLSGVQMGISTIIIDIDEQTYTLAQQAISDDVTYFVDYTNNLISAAKSVNSQWFNDQPPTTTTSVPSAVSTILSNLQTANALGEAEGHLQAIQLAMTGNTSPPLGGPVVVQANQTATNMVTLNAKIELNDKLGIHIGSDTDQWGDFPVRSSTLLDTALSTYELYAQYQALACYVVAEAAHASPNPGADTPTGLRIINDAARSLQSQRAQLPAYTSSGIIVDLPYGLMWTWDVQSPRTYLDARNYAASYPSYGGGWRLPTYNEAKALQQRGLWATAAEGTVDYGNVVSGLAPLGFGSLGNLNSDGEIWCATWTTNGSTWTDITGGDLYYRLTHESQEYAVDFSGTLQKPFLMVKSIGEPVIGINNPGLNGPVPGWPPQFSNLINEQNSYYLGTLTGFSPYTIEDGYGRFTGLFKVSTGSPSFVLGNDNNQTTDSTTTTFTTTTSGYSGNYPYVTVDNENSVSVSNLPVDFGQLFYHANYSPTTLRFSSIGLSSNNQFPTVIEGSGPSVPPPTGFTVRQTGTQIGPRNVLMNLQGNNAITTQQFTFTGFYSDRTVQDLTGQTTWTVGDANNNGAAIPGVRMSVSTPGLLDLSDYVKGSATELNLIITATQPGNTSSTPDDTVKVRVAVQ